MQSGVSMVMLCIYASFPTDGPLALQTVPEPTVIFERSEDIAACGLAFADVMRNTRFFSDFFGVQNVNGSLTSTCTALSLVELLHFVIFAVLSTCRFHL